MNPLPETVESIDREIAELQARLPLVEGTPCQVFDRVTGYYQPVQNWNPGKMQEFKERKRFGMSKGV
jgi:hypothetical protein